MMDVKRQKYLAGLVDGRGIIAVERHANGKHGPSYVVSLKFSSVRIPFLEKIKKEIPPHFDANIVKGILFPNGIRQYFLKFTARDGIKMLKELRMHLKYKGDEADLALDMAERIASYPRSSKPMEQHELDMRADIFDKFKQLKKSKRAKKQHESDIS